MAVEVAAVSQPSGITAMKHFAFKTLFKCTDLIDAIMLTEEKLDIKFYILVLKCFNSYTLYLQRARGNKEN